MKRSSASLRPAPLTLSFLQSTFVDYDNDENANSLALSLSAKRSAARRTSTPQGTGTFNSGHAGDECLPWLDGSSNAGVPGMRAEIPACVNADEHQNQLSTSDIGRSRLSCNPAKDTLQDVSQVLPKLYVGSESAADCLSLRGDELANRISHVLNCSRAPSALESEESHLTCLRLGLTDSGKDLEQIHDVIKQGVAFIDQAIERGGTVFVHCKKGISRSCTLAMAYLMWKQRATAEEAFAQLRAARAVCDPNFGFRVALKEWECQVKFEINERDQPARQKQRIDQAWASSCPQSSPQSQLCDAQHVNQSDRKSGSDDGFLPP